MQPLRAAFRRFDSQRLQSVRLEVFAGLLPFLGLAADPRARRHHEERHMIARTAGRIEHVVAEAQAILPKLASEMEGVDGTPAARGEKLDIVTIALGFQKPP